LNSVCPIMPGRDLETKTFYPGFQAARDHADEGYLILERDAVELHFFRAPDHDPWTSDHGAFVRVADANALSAQYADLDLPREGIPRLGTAGNKAWGACELHVIDPDGNLIRMGHVLE
jgi:catechol 2,3-dioxygenase-like lactoylglutathione lyase family enzyme